MGDRDPAAPAGGALSPSRVARSSTLSVRELVRRLPTQARVTSEAGCLLREATTAHLRRGSPGGRRSISIESSACDSSDKEFGSREPAARCGSAAEHRNRGDSSPCPSADRYGGHFTADVESILVSRLLGALTVAGSSEYPSARALENRHSQRRPCSRSRSRRRAAEGCDGPRCGA